MNPLPNTPSASSTPGNLGHNATPAADSGDARREARRRLLRAGLAAGPVLLASQSRTVLAAGQCASTSAFASLQAAQNAGVALSHCPPNAPRRLKSPQALANPTPSFSTINTPAPGSTNRYFYTQNQFTTALGSSNKKSGKRFDKGLGKKSGNPAHPATPAKASLEFQRINHYSDNPTVLQVLNGQDDLAKLLAAAVLNKELGLDDNNILPSIETCRQIWVSQGAWIPPGSSRTWTRTDTVAWLKYVFNA